MTKYYVSNKLAPTVVWRLKDNKDCMFCGADKKTWLPSIRHRLGLLKLENEITEEEAKKLFPDAFSSQDKEGQ